MPLVGISDVIEAAKDGPRCLQEGERVLDAKMLVTVGSLGMSDNSVLKVWAMCIKSSNVSGAPHTLEATLNLRTIYKRVMKISCDCKAGNSEKCKHCIALLMYLNRLDDASDLEDLSCTDLTQQWGKLKKGAASQFVAIPVHQFCHYTPPKPIYADGIPDVSDDLAAEFAKLITEGAPTGERFLHSTGARAGASSRNCQPNTVASEILEKRQLAGKVTEQLLDRPKAPFFSKLKKMTEEKVKLLSPELLDFYQKNIALSAQQSVMLSSNTALQSEPEWEAARKCRITGSRVYSLFTYTNNKDPDWEKKMKSTFESSFKPTPAMLHGIEQEPCARKAYATKIGHKVIENGLVVHPELPWLGYSADGVKLSEEEVALRLLEIKSPATGKQQTAAKVLEGAECCDKKSHKLKIKHKYHGQVQLGMFLLGLQECDFLLWSSFDGTYALQTVKYCDAFVSSMLAPLVDVFFDIALPYFYDKSQDSENEDDVE